MVISDFQSLLNQSFKIVFSDTEYPLELIEVESLGEPYKKGAREPFSLVFVTDSANGLLQQGRYPVEGGEFQKTDIFLVPIAEQNGRYHYQAVYN